MSGDTRTGEVARLVLTAEDTARAMEGRLVSGDAESPIGRVSIDSRTVQPGDLFFAIRGERFDGHDFVDGALAAGAAGVVVSDRGRVAALHGTDGAAAGAGAESGEEASTAGVARAAAPDANGRAMAAIAIAIVIEVEDTTRALQALAREVRRGSRARVIAITGSAGKTTTKEVTAEFLALRYRTFRNRGNLNNHIGLPLSLIELRTRPEMAVVELGMSAPGEIRTLVGIAEPDVRVWTNVGEAHLESFPSVEAIADAKSEILENADGKDCLVINANDPRIVARARAFPGRVWTFGIDAPADVSATHVRDRGLAGVGATVRISAGLAARAFGGQQSEEEEVAASDRSVTVELATPLVGRANLANVLAGMAVALDAGVLPGELVARAATLAPAAHRGEVLRLASGVTVLDDAYNANPLAVTRALEVMAAEPHAARRVAVLGEMLELGPDSMRLHQACGREAVQAHVDLLITVGGDPARALGDAAVDAGLARAAVTHVADSSAAADLIETLVRPGDLVLVKGSRGIRLERVVERLHGAHG